MVVCCGVGGTECSSACIGLLKEFAIIFITSTIVWSQVKQQGGPQPCSLAENLIKELLSMAMLIRTRPSFSYSQFLPSGSFHKPLILNSVREKIE